jgi:Mg2+-importing ATPase
VNYSFALADAATLTPERVLSRLDSDARGLTADEAGKRLARFGRNELRGRRAGPVGVLARQLRSTLLLLLLGTALVSFAVGDGTEAAIILGIVSLSVGLGFVNEFRAAGTDSLLELPSCAFMGTIVRSGNARGVVVATGARTAFGGIAMRLRERTT